MKKTLIISLTAVLAAICVPFTAFAAQDPTYGSVYYYDDELLEEFGPSQVSVPYSEHDSGGWLDVDNSFKFLMIDGTLENDSKIFTESGFTLVPIRLVSDKLGATVDYDPLTKKITISKGETELILASGASKAIVNGKEMKLDAAVKNDSGTTYVPIRFIVENLGGVADYISFDASILPVFPTVAIDSAEFIAQKRMSDDEALAFGREKLLSALSELAEYINGVGNPYKPDAEEFEKTMAELTEDLENVKISGKYVSCYLMLETEYSRFIINTLNGDLFTAYTSTFSYRIKPFEYYDIGNAYFYN